MRNVNFNKFNILILYYMFFTLLLAVVVFFKPALNWDMLGYVASAKHYEIADQVELHDFVFESLKNNVSEGIYFTLIDGGSEFKIDMSTKPELFMQQLPFYEIRPVYNLSVLLVSKSGVNIFMATYLVSLFSTIVGLYILLFTFKDRIHYFLLFTIPVFLLFFGGLNVAKHSTPDALVFMSVSVFMLLFSKEKIQSLLAIIPFFVLIRTDMIIFDLLTFAAIYFLYENYRFKMALSMMLTIVLYLAVNHLFNNYGWETIFSFTFVERVSNPADADMTVSVLDYCHVFAIGVFESLDDRVFLGFASIVLCSLFVMKITIKSFSDKREIFVYSIIPLLYILVHFMLFPVTWDRFFVGFYMMFIVSTLLLLSIMIKGYDSSHCCSTVSKQTIVTQ